MISARVGEVSRRAAHEAGPVLPEAKRAAFMDEVKLRCFPRIYAASPVIAAIKAAEEMKDVSAEQRTRLAELKDGYEREAATVNARWAAAAEEKLRQLPEKFLEMTQGGPEEDPKDSFVAARKERRDLDERYRSRVSEVLTQDQRDRLPKPENSGGHGIPEFLPDIEADFKGEWEQWKGEGG